MGPLSARRLLLGSHDAAELFEKALLNGCLLGGKLLGNKNGYFTCQSVFVGLDIRSEWFGWSYYC